MVKIAHVGPITGPSGNVFWSHRGDVEGKRYVTTGEIEHIGVIGACHRPHRVRTSARVLAMRQIAAGMILCQDPR